MGSFYTKNNSGAILLANQDIAAATGTAEAAFGEHHQQRTAVRVLARGLLARGQSEHQWHGFYKFAQVTKQ
jgi:hypothetical protein